MRIFEIILVLVIFFSLVLNFKRRSKAIGLRIAGGNLAALLLHGIFEGFRYQMFFSYVFVILLVLFTLVRINRKSEAKTPMVLRGIAISLSFVLLASTSFLAYTLPVFALPEPTGSYAVGVQYFHLIDENRLDPFLVASSKKRELMVKIYYPAKEDGTKSFSPYFHDSTELIQSFATFYNLPDFTFDHLRLIRTHSKEGLQVSDQQPNYPVILFSHGAGTTMEVQTSQYEDLASHGYIVVAIDHTYVSAATIFPDRVVSAKEATTDFHTAEPAEIITQIMADDAEFVIGKLSEINDGKIDSAFEAKLNLDQIGVIGHSVGGAAAYNLAINDSRVKAAINLDGRVYITPKDSQNMTPFLMLANDKFHIQTLRDRKSLLRKFDELTEDEQKTMLFMYGSKEKYQEAYNKDYQSVIGLTEALEASGNLFTIEGSDHMKFTDIGLFIGVSQIRERVGIGGKTDSLRCLEITKALTLAFFDRYVKGENKDALMDLIKKYPELKRVDLK